MIKRNKLKNRIKTKAIGAAAMCLAAVMMFECGRIDPEGNAAEKPDAVSSSYDGSRCRLIVTANRDHIGDREAFAWELFRLCRENSFYTIKLSTDISGWPSSVEMVVYLHRNDIGTEGPEMHISFLPPDSNGEYNIKDNGEKYHVIIQ